MKDPCAKKRRYHSPERAAAALRVMKRNFWAKKLETKWCELCGGWHLARAAPPAPTAP